MNRPDYISLVTSAIHRVGRAEIARADTVFVALADPSGVRLTMADGREMLFRAFVTTANQPQVAPRPPVLPQSGLPSSALDSGE